VIPAWNGAYRSVPRAISRGGFVIDTATIFLVIVGLLVVAGDLDLASLRGETCAAEEMDCR